MKKKASLALENRLEEFARVNAWLEAFWQEHRDIPEAWMFEAEVVLEEVITNAIKYGYREGERGRIELELGLDAEGLEIVIVDDARPFDPTQAPEPDLNLPLEARPVGGLGIHMVRNLMDSVAYDFSGGKNRLKLRKQCGSFDEFKS